MREILSHFRKLDWIIIATTLLLAGISLLSLYSSSLGRGDFSNFKKQIVFMCIGYAIMLLVSLLDWRIFQENSYLILVLYLICLISLVGLFFLAPEIRGVKSWYKIGPISIDPTEYIKIVLLILLAKYFSARHIELYRIRHILISSVYILIPTILIFPQPNLGSIIIIIALWVGILLVSGIKIRHFLILFLCLLLISIFSWMFLFKPYQKERIINFLQPQLEPLGTGWSQSQSKIAIGSGGILGQGMGQGSQTQYGFLPEVQTDFIFASLSEEFGLVGVLVLLILFSLLIWRIMKIAISVQTNFPRLVASGLAIILASQAFIHIGMNLGLLPIIGIPLPFISYGGSNLITLFLGLGILQSIKSH